jgi:ribosomal-protein-alanine N-acetyltransferase
MHSLETERLVIRNFVAEDWEALHEMIVQYQSSEFATYDGRWPTSPEEFKGIVERFAERDGFMAVCLKDTGRFIGFVAINPEGGKGEYNLGYIFNSDYHGKGYATEACRAVLAYAFNHLNASRIVTGTAADNQPSWHLLVRLGFKWIVESMGSRQNNADGTPIMFRVYKYELPKVAWQSIARP